MCAEVLFDDAKLFKGIVSAISAIVDEATIKVDPNEGLKLSALEPAKTAMVQLVLPPDVFSEFKVESEGYYTINFKDFEKVLKRIKGANSVKLEFTESRLVVSSVADYRKTFRLPLLVGEPFEMKSPKVEFKSRLRMDSRKLPEIVGDLKLMGSDVRISIDSEKAVFKVESDRGESETVLTREDPAVMDIWSDEPSESMYPLSYLDKMAGPAKVVGEVRIEISTERPMKMFYPIGGISEAGIIYYLAHVSEK